MGLEELKILSGIVDNTQNTNPEVYTKIYDAIRKMEFFTDHFKMFEYTLHLGFKGEKFIKMLEKDFGGDAFKYGEHLLKEGFFRNFQLNTIERVVIDPTTNLPIQDFGPYGKQPWKKDGDHPHPYKKY